MPLNMKKEIRAELRTLKKARNQIERGWLRDKKSILRSVATGERAVTRELFKINRRILILEGRLS